MRLPRWLIVVTGVPLPLIVPLPSPPTTVPPVGFARHTRMPRVNTKPAKHNDTILIFIHVLPEDDRDAPEEVPATLMPTIISDFAALIIQRTSVRQGIYDCRRSAIVTTLHMDINERERRTLQINISEITDALPRKAVLLR